MNVLEFLCQERHNSLEQEYNINGISEFRARIRMYSRKVGD